MKGFSEQVHIHVQEFQKRVIHSDLVLTQKMMAHHEFTFMWHYTATTVISAEEQLVRMRKSIGFEVIFTFKSAGGTKLMSKGLIKGFGSDCKNGSPVGLKVFGVSHTILLNDFLKSRIFKNQTIQEIALDIFFKHGIADFYHQEAIKPTYTKRLDAVTQYEETNFDFLKRLAARRGQWFYFDGMRMQFGELKATSIKLIHGSSLHNFNTHVKLESQKSSLSGYDYDTAQLIQSYREKSESISLNGHSKLAHNDIGSISHSHQKGYGVYTTQASNSAEIDEMTKLQTAGSNATNVTYTGTSYLPLGLGQKVVIMDGDIKLEVLIIEVTHLSKVYGNYSCEFVAIPNDVYAPPYTDVKIFAEAKVQSAKVIGNNDPEGLGRVMVRFFWQGGNFVESDWMRVATPYAGAGRGSYHTPEIGDEVIIDFIGGDIESPFVSLSFYNGQAKPEFFDEKNMIKGWRFRYGQLLKFIEKIGIWLSDPSGNEIHLDTENKNMNFTTPGTLTLNCEDLIINVSKTMITTVGQTATETVTLGKSISVGELLSTTAGNKALRVKGSYDEDIEGDFNSHTAKERNETGLGGIQNSSENDLTKHSKNNIKYNSGEGTSQN